MTESRSGRESDVVQGACISLRDRDAVVIAVVAQKRHPGGAVRELEPQQVRKEPGRVRDIGRVEHDVGNPLRPVREAFRIGVKGVFLDHADDAPLRILEGEAVATARLRDGLRGVTAVAAAAVTCARTARGLLTNAP